MYPRVILGAGDGPLLILSEDQLAKSIGGIMNEMNLNDKREKEDRKKGFIGWLREKLGFAPRGMGNLTEGARGINLSNLGRASVFAGRGASLSKGVGFFGVLGGKGAIITFALVAFAVGATLYYRSMDNNTQSSSGESLGYMGDASSYVPRILREQQTGSTLDMFRKANEGIIKEEDDSEYKYKNQEEPKPDKEQIVANLGFDNKDSLPLDAKKRLQTDMKFGLSTAFGDGSGNKFSAIGGFGNHMGKFGPSVGSGFAKTDLNSATNSLLRKASGSKLSIMNQQRRPLIAKGPTLRGMPASRSTFDQAKAIKGMALQPNYGSGDVARHTLDKAWEGTTGGGSVGLPTGGSGVASGGEGIVQTPSTLDNIGDTTAGVPNNQVPTGIPNHSFDTPWASLLQKAMMLLMMSAALAAIAAIVAKIKPWGMIVAVALALAAVAMAVMVINIGMQIMSSFGQSKLGMIYIIAGMISIGAAIAAIAGVNTSWGQTLSLILAATAGIMAMFAAMAAGPASKDYMKKQIEQNTQQQQPSARRTSYPNLLA